MRAVRYLPLTYLCGVHGFAIFAPYLLIVLIAVNCLRRPRPVLIPIRTDE